MGWAVLTSIKLQLPGDQPPSKVPDEREERTDNDCSR
jgi:hypothetical protein